MKADTAALQDAGEVLQTFYTALSTPVVSEDLSAEEYVRKLGFECETKKQHWDYNSRDHYRRSSNLSATFIAASSLNEDLRGWILDEKENLTLDREWDTPWLQKVLQHRPMGGPLISVVPLGFDERIFGIDEVWGDRYESLRDRAVEDMYEKLESGYGYIPVRALERVLNELKTLLYQGWDEEVEKIRAAYSAHPNSSSHALAHITTATSHNLNHIHFHERSKSLTGYLRNPKGVIKAAMEVIEEVFSILEPDGFGAIRSLMQQPGSKRHFRKVLKTLQNMEKTGEFYNVTLPYVHSVMDRSWRVSDRELTTDKYDKEIAGLTKVWKVETMKGYKLFHSHNALPGDPEVILFKYPNGIPQLSPLAERVSYPNVKVIVFDYPPGMLVPVSERFPNVEKVYTTCRVNFVKEVEEMYPQAEYLDGKSSTSAINDFFSKK
jgi:hypothetical protein